MLKEKSKKVLILTVISIMMFNLIGPNMAYAFNSDTDFESEILQGTTIEDLLNQKDDNSYIQGDLDAEQQAQQGNMDIIVPGSSVDASTGQVVKPGSSIEDPTADCVQNKTKLNRENEIAKAIGAGFSTVADGLVGIFTYLERLKVVIVGGVFQFLGTVVGESAGTMETGMVTLITTDDILFNKLAITDINFFNMTSFGTLSNQKALSGSDNPIKLLKENVANWYKTLRLMAMVILLVILIYIGIRMALASNPESKVNYKAMFKNWLVSFALVFLLHYIIIFVLYLNAVLVDMIASVGNKALAINDGFMSNYVSKLIFKSLLMPWATVSWSAAIVYLCIVALTFIFLIMYIKRMITIAFLILISPIITITYSIDKAGDNKAQAFSAWMKEFLHNVLIQPFHCIIYVAFVAISVNILEEAGTLASAVLVIVTMFFILEAENLIKQIFGIDSKSTGSALATAAVLSTAYEKLKPDKKDKKAVPSNVNNGNKSQVASNTRNGNHQTMTASNNMAANSRYTEADRKNEELSRIVSGETGAVGYDHYQTMNYEEDKNEDLSRIMSGESADAQDYEELMDSTPRRNRVYGVLGKNEATADTTEGTADTVADVPMPNVKNNNPKSDYEDMKDGVKGVARGTWDVLKAGNKATSGLAGAVIGGSLAGLSGQNLANTIGSVLVGEKIQDNLEEKADTAYNTARANWEQHVRETHYRNDQRNLATAFSNFKGEAEYNQAADIQQARQYLKMPSNKINDIPEENVRQYVQALHAMRSINSKNFEGDANEKTIETMEKIIRGEIQPNNV